MYEFQLLFRVEVFLYQIHSYSAEPLIFVLILRAKGLNYTDRLL